MGVLALAVVLVAVGATVATHRGGTAPTTTEVVAKDASTRLTPFNATLTPAANATQVPTDAIVTVNYSVPVTTSSPVPTIAPTVAGRWQTTSPTTMQFVPMAPWTPLTTVTVTVPAGTNGPVSTTGQHLTNSAISSFQIQGGSTLRLQELLAQLNYLPLTFTPAHPSSDSLANAQPEEGTFAWRFTPPSYLGSQWTAGSPNVITRGAVMAFENAHGLVPDGVAGPAVWQALLTDSATGAATTSPYDYVYVSKQLPETATVYRNGAEVYSTLANTGAAGVATDSGTYPVFEHLRSTTMKGTNPDGSTYNDPGIPWVSYFHGGDALHGYVRASYGFPQSLGCVELPPANAAVVWPYTPIGTLVTVSG